MVNRRLSAYARVMRESEMVEAAQVDIDPNAAAKMTAAVDGWFGREQAVKAVRQAVTAWAMAVNGDESALASIADPNWVRTLMFPGTYNAPRPHWVVAPGPALTELTIWKFEPAASPPTLKVKWQFAGRRRWIDADPSVAGDGDGDELILVGWLELGFTGSGAWPWRLSHGFVEACGDRFGYTFARGTETVDEYRQRVGYSAACDGLVPTDSYLLVVGFAEDDVKYGSTVSVEVSSDAPVTREEAVELVEPAMQADIVEARGGELGDWHPRLAWLRVIRLVGPA
jgi:hypothetical protein